MPQLMYVDGTNVKIIICQIWCLSSNRKEIVVCVIHKTVKTLFFFSIIITSDNSSYILLINYKLRLL